ncbi:MAG: aminotransferase class V-fold PLP-dependent enzyme, partial [Bacteroidota bacterium]|nr:aminotransferase class V-fold PLP-dependent enzyme [Bacteroidota bacterium]
IPINPRGEFDMDWFENNISEKTKIVAVAHVSNALGTINPVEEIIRIAHQHGVPVLLDGAQATPHLDIDVKKLDVDFYAFSSHKMYGPTGIGILYGKSSWLNILPPWQG